MRGPYGFRLVLDKKAMDVLQRTAAVHLVRALEVQLTTQLREQPCINTNT